MQGSTIPFRPVEFQLDAAAFIAAPGGSVAIPFALLNHTGREDYFDLTLQGIPADWVLLDLPVMHLAEGERRESSLTIQAPGSAPLSAGVYPVVMRATSQADRSVWGEASFDLRVQGYENTMQAAPYVSSGQVEVALDTNEFTITPGDTLAIPVRITNLSLEEDTFYLTVEGLPGNWVSGPAQVVQLLPHQSQELTLAIQPTIGPDSQAGRRPFRLRVSSQAAPGQSAVVDAVLTMAAVSQFFSDLTPRHIEAGRRARVRIQNLGNIPESYTVRWRDLGTAMSNSPGTAHGNSLGTAHSNSLEFVPVNDGPVLVRPGETAAVDFDVSPRSPNWFGKTVTLPYRVTVQSGGGETQEHHGEVISHSLIPIWVLPALAVFCLTAACGLGFLWNWNQTRLAGVKATAEAQVRPGAAQTATAQFIVVTGGTATASTAAAAAMTAAAVPGPTATQTATPQFTPTASQTASPSPTTILTYTPIPPTATYTSAPPTNTAPPPTNTVPPPTNTVPPPTSTATATLAPTATATETATLAPSATATQQPTATATVTIAPSPTVTLIPLPVTGQQLFVFVSNRDGSPHLYLFNAADASTKALTSGAGADTDPAWSPDGKLIAFTTDRDGNNEIYVMGADGTNPVNLTNNAADDRYPAWSPDGSKIAFTTNRDGNNEIYVMNADGSNPVNLTNNPASDFKAVWYTQSGLLTSTSRILFTTDRDGNNEIYSMHTDGSAPANLTKNPASDSLPAILAGGGQVAFVSNRDGNNEIYVMKTDGDGQTNLTKNPADDSSPVWSPDGKWIAFTTNRDGNQEVYLMAADGSQVTNLTNSPGNDSNPTWR